MRLPQTHVVVLMLGPEDLGAPKHGLLMGFELPLGSLHTAFAFPRLTAVQEPGPVRPFARAIQSPGGRCGRPTWGTACVISDV